MVTRLPGGQTNKKSIQKGGEINEIWDADRNESPLAIINLCFQDSSQRCIFPDGYAAQSPPRTVLGSRRPPAGSGCGCYRGRRGGPGP